MAEHESPRVAILMGSRSDWPVMRLCAQTLDRLEVSHEVRVISAHRKPGRLGRYVAEAQDSGVKVFIAGAGGAAHLPAAIASRTVRPVLGVPMKTSMMGGLDSLLSIVQMPKGIPVGTLAAGQAGAINAAILAGEILALGDEALARRLDEFRAEQAAALSEEPE